MAKINEKPAIRFAGFTDPWEQRKLGEILCFLKDGTHGTHQDVEDGPLLLSAKNIKNGQICWDSGDRRISESEYEKIHSNFTLEKEDILLTIVGSIGETAILKDNYRITFQRSVAYLRPTADVKPVFLYSELQSPKFQNELMNRKSTSAQPGIYLGDLSVIPVSYPKNLEEQKQIGSAFVSLDNLITLHQRKYDKLKNVKKSCLEKMFPKDGENIPELRFAGFTDPWEQRKFDGEIELFSGLTYSPNDVNKKGTFVLRSSNVKNGEIVDADNVYVDSEVVNSSNVREGDIIVVVRNGPRSLIGKHAQIKRRMEQTVIGAFMTGIRSSQSTFINALLDTQQFNSEVEKNLGATINQITNGMFRKMQFMFPGIEEEDSIGSYFHHLDNLITLHQRELNKFQNIKKSCLEKMFV